MVFPWMLGYRIGVFGSVRLTGILWSAGAQRLRILSSVDIDSRCCSHRLKCFNEL